MEATGKLCIFVGYAKNHAGDTYCMFNPTTKRVIISRDIQWLNKTYGKWARENQHLLDPEDIIADEVEEETINNNSDDDNGTYEHETGREIKEETNLPTIKEEQMEIANDEEDDESPKGPNSNARLIQELSRLGTWYNQDATCMVEEAKAQEEKINTAFEPMQYKREYAFVMQDLMLESYEIEKEKESKNKFFVPADVSDE